MCREEIVALDLFRENQHLIYRSDDLLCLNAAQFKVGGRRLNDHVLVVPDNLEVAQALTTVNFPVPAPMSSYDWPHAPGHMPRAHQVVMANFQVLNPKCYNLSDMGSMKTLATLWAADFLMRQYPGFRALIVCPLSIMQRVWGNAIFKHFLNRRTYRILHGNAARRQRELDKPADFYIINPDGVGIGGKVVQEIIGNRAVRKVRLDALSKSLADRSDIQLVIIDEASCYKHQTTARHRIDREVINSRPYMWMLTGTPCARAPTDAYGLAHMMGTHGGQMFTSFRNATMFKKGNFKWIPKPDGYAKAWKLLQPAIRFAIEDVWDAPELTTQQRDVELTSAQTKAWNELKRNFMVQVNDGTVTAVNQAVMRSKFLQVAAGVVYDQEKKGQEIDSGPRIKELKEIIDTAPAGGKLLVFAAFTAVINMLARELSEYSVAIVNGAVSAKNRSDIFRAFQEDETPRIIIADPGTMAHGLDLWRARVVVWYTPIDSTEEYLQANKRAHRPGQEFPVTVVQLIASKLEEGIFKAREENTDDQNILLDLARSNML
jgi:SNF2 family DNA or RNA helicase